MSTMDSCSTADTIAGEATALAEQMKDIEFPSVEIAPGRARSLDVLARALLTPIKKRAH